MDPTFSLPISTVTTSILAIWLLTLSWRVIGLRRKGGASLGDGGDPALQRAIRAQGNLVEYTPVFLIMLALAEIQGGNALIIGAIAAAFTLGRLGHGYAFAFTPRNVMGRVGGTALTLGTIGLLALHNLFLAV